MTKLSIAHVIDDLRHGFLALNLEPPEVLILKSNREGMKVLCELHNLTQLVYQPGAHGKPVKHPDGSVWIEVVFMDMKIRWPAQATALESGGFVWG